MRDNTHKQLNTDMLMFKYSYIAKLKLECGYKKSKSISVKYEQLKYCNKDTNKLRHSMNNQKNALLFLNSTNKGTCVAIMQIIYSLNVNQSGRCIY